MFRSQLFLTAQGQPLNGSGVIVLGRNVILRATLIWPNRLLSSTAVGCIVWPTTIRMAIAVVNIFIITKITLPKRHVLFHIFQPLATQCLHRTTDEILSTPKEHHVIDVFPSSCSRVDLSYRGK